MTAAARPVPADAYLGVERSLGGRRWIARPADDRQALALAQRLAIPELVARVLAARGVGLDEGAAYLQPTLRDLLPDPSHLKDMDVAAERLATAVMQGERIALFGDYDVDGATSSALLTRFLRAVGGQPQVYIPDRLTEGYGPNAPALLKLRGAGASVAVTVDCGSTAHEPLGAARDAGLDVIVVDHHAAEALLPPAVAVVNPNRLDEDSPHRHMAAVGVSFLLAVAVNRALRAAGWYRGGKRAEPDLMGWLDLVALGTVCDVVPLVGVNRALVAQGLKVMGRRLNRGLTALADVAGIAEPPGAYHAGFVLGPRINAGGRIGAADLGARLLTTEDPDEAVAIAHRLNDLNRERQEIEAAVLDAAIAQAEDQAKSRGDAGPLVLVAGEGWHPGVVGIVASRLKDRFNRPACVVALDGDRGQASGRSVSGVDLGAAVIAARQAGLLEKGGGHAMAAGFTVARDRLPAVRDFLADRLRTAAEGTDLVPRLYLDGGVAPRGATEDLVRTLAQAGPFGAGNPEPRFVLKGVRLTHAAPVGKDQNHLRCTLADDSGGRVDGIAFRCMDGDLGPALLRHDGAPFHVAGKLRLNNWQGRTSVQVMIDDAAPVW